MIRGTTPTHTFTLPIDTVDIAKLRLTYCQNKQTVVEKTEADVNLSGKRLEYTLSQAESLAFDVKTPVEIQIKMKTYQETVVASKIMRFNVTEVLNEEVL